MKRGLILVLLILLLIPSISAQRLFVTHDLLTEKVTPGGTAVFQLNVRNNQNVEDTFSITPDEFSIAPFSDIVENIEIDDGNLKISANSVGTTIVRIRLKEDLKPGRTYGTFVRVRSLSNPNLKIDHDLTISVVPPDEVIEIKSNIPDEVVPGRTLSINVDLRNKVNLIIDNIDISIDSELFSEKSTIKIFPYQDSTKTFEFEIPPATLPGTYTLIITATKANKLQGAYIKDFEIIKNPNINERTERDSGFLTNTVNLMKSNNGNLVVNEAFILEINGFKRMFTSYNIAPTRIQDNNVIWEFELVPGESYSVNATTDYRALFVLLIAFGIFLGVMWYLYGRRVTIRKAVFKVKDDKGGISEIKVLLHIKNRLTNLSDVEVVDVVPNFIRPKHEFGTLQPAKMQRGSRGIRMLWHLPELLEGEERVISYEIESQLHILGKLVLPKAKVRYKRKGKIVEVNSNKLTYFSSKEK